MSEKKSTVKKPRVTAPKDHVEENPIVQKEEPKVDELVADKVDETEKLTKVDEAADVVQDVQTEFDDDWMDSKLVPSESRESGEVAVTESAMEEVVEEMAVSALGTVEGEFKKWLARNPYASYYEIEVERERRRTLRGQA